MADLLFTIGYITGIALPIVLGLVVVYFVAKKLKGKEEPTAEPEK